MLDERRRVQDEVQKLEFNLLSLAETMRKDAPQFPGLPRALEDVASVIVGLHAYIVQLEARCR